jgi:hypothetical protein
MALWLWFLLVAVVLLAAGAALLGVAYSPADQGDTWPAPAHVWWGNAPDFLATTTGPSGPHSLAVVPVPTSSTSRPALLYFQRDGAYTPGVALTNDKRAMPLTNDTGVTLNSYTRTSMGTETQSVLFVLWCDGANRVMEGITFPTAGWHTVMYRSTDFQETANPVVSVQVDRANVADSNTRLVSVRGDVQIAAVLFYDETLTDAQAADAATAALEWRWTPQGPTLRPRKTWWIAAAAAGSAGAVAGAAAVAALLL